MSSSGKFTSETGKIITAFVNPQKFVIKSDQQESKVVTKTVETRCTPNTLNLKYVKARQKVYSFTISLNLFI